MPTSACRRPNCGRSLARAWPSCGLSCRIRHCSERATFGHSANRCLRRTRRPTLLGVSVWFSIEVLDGSASASLWSEAYGDALVESALSSGASDWNWHRHSWGAVLELAFENEQVWERFRELPAVQAALDAVPDPVSGLIVYRGRGE